MVLNKVRVPAVIGALFTILRLVLPMLDVNLDLAPGLEAAVVTVAMFIAGFFTPESQERLASLRPNPYLR